VTRTYAGIVQDGVGGGALGLTKAGTGTLVLTRNETYTGDTTINGGTLLANNTTGSVTGSGTVSVGLSGTLGGSGAVGGNTTVNGSLKPGNGVGSLTFGGSLSLNTGSQTVMEISGLVPTTEFDQIFVSGAFSIGGTLKIVLVNGFAPTAGASFDLFNWGSQTATFDSLDFSAAVLGSGLAWDSSTLYTNGVLSVVVAVPEPAGWGAAMGGLLAIAALCRRRKTARENPSAS
jgi:MYXO-CTERM domain-containing protein